MAYFLKIKPNITRTQIKKNKKILEYSEISIYYF